MALSFATTRKADIHLQRAMAKRCLAVFALDASRRVARRKEIAKRLRSLCEASSLGALPAIPDNSALEPWERINPKTNTKEIQSACSQIISAAAIV